MIINASLPGSGGVKLACGSYNCFSSSGMILGRMANVISLSLNRRAADCGLWVGMLYWPSVATVILD